MGHKIPITLTKAKKKQIYLPSKPTLTILTPPEHLQLINFHECANKRRPICMQKLRPAPQPPGFIQLISRECFSSTTTGSGSVLFFFFFSPFEPMQRQAKNRMPLLFPLKSRNVENKRAAAKKAPCHTKAILFSPRFICSWINKFVNKRDNRIQIEWNQGAAALLPYPQSTHTRTYEHCVRREFLWHWLDGG